jgi:hypothetical protein
MVGDLIGNSRNTRTVLLISPAVAKGTSFDFRLMRGGFAIRWAL